MLKANNTHFEEIKKLDADYARAKSALLKEKEQIAEKYGWQSIQMEELKKKESRLTYPISMGMAKAARAYWDSIEKNEKLTETTVGMHDAPVSQELEMRDFLWHEEVGDFLDTLKKAEIKSFIYTNSSTAAMENMHAFEAHGWKMIGLAKIKRMVQKFGSEEIETTIGVYFAI